MQRYQYILLDWDGNLARTLDIWLEAFRTVLIEAGHALSDKDIAASFGKFGDLVTSLGLSDPDSIYNKADAIAKRALPEVELYPDALEVLAGLKSLGKQTALITTSNRENIDHLLTKYDMHGLFDVVITHEDTTEHKPHPEPLLKALEKLGGTAKQAIMIGDSDKDLGAAQNASVDSILFYPDEHQKFYDLDTLKRHNPTHIVNDFKELLDIVR